MREAHRVRRAEVRPGRVVARAGVLAGLLAGLLACGCAGGPAGPAASMNASGPGDASATASGSGTGPASDALRPAASIEPVAAAVASPAAAPAALAADTLAPGLSRDAVVATLSAIDGREPSCEAAKVPAPGTGRAFLHERCRRDWTSPSPVAYVDPDGIDPDGGEGPRLRLAHVDLIDGVAVRVDLLTETAGGTREIVLVDPRLQAVMPALASAAPPTPADP